MTDTRRILGIYGVLPEGLETSDLLARAEAALAGGVKTLQLRDKQCGFKQALTRAKSLTRLIREHEGARLLINDSLQLACDSGADGVHLGRSDMQSIAAMRAQAGDTLLIGISCQGDAAFAGHVLGEGADYVSFGAIFPTTSKQNVLPIGLPRLSKARQIFPSANICAIGGISLEALPAIRMAGADCAAVISSLFDSGNIEAQARIMVDTWNNTQAAA